MRKAVCCIKPNGELAGYYEHVSDVTRVLLNADLKRLVACVHSGEVYMGLKWMWEPDFKDAYFMKKDLSFPVPKDYHIYLKKPFRTTKEREREMRMEQQATEKLRLIEQRKKDRESREKNARACMRNREVICIETGKVYKSAMSLALELGSPYSTIYNCIKEGTKLRLNGRSYKYI